MSGPAPLLEAVNLSKHYRVGSWIGGRTTVRALDGVSLAVRPGETLGLVGESGCGKSTFARCVLRLTDVTAGQVHFDGIDITRTSQRALRPHRRQMQIVFQDPTASLNPRRRTGDLIAEPLRVHGRRSRADIRARVVELMHLVGLHPDHLGRFPHELSGGQRQRIGIARALALAPKLIVADEPVSALDVSIQAQIINLFMDLQERLGLTYVFISHDLRVVRQVSTRMAVMYHGAIVELGPTEAIFRAPAHPYAAALMASVPRAEADARLADQPPAGDGPGELLETMGCRFQPRCPTARDRCRAEAPPLRDLGKGRAAACHFPLADGAAHDRGRHLG